MGIYENGQNTSCIVLWPQDYGDRGVKHGALNKNDPHRLLCLYTWFPVSGTVWKGSGGVILLEEMLHGDGF